MNIILSVKNLSKFEKILLLLSIAAVTASFLLCGMHNVLTLIASLIGVCALTFNAKGDVLGQILTVVFAALYAIISWQFQYYGEMITYLGMTAPIAILAVVTWTRNPYSKKQVKIKKLTARNAVLLVIAASLTTWGFYYILAALGTNNLVLSTISIATSFFAATLTMLRSPSYAIAYAANDIVLMILWILAALEDRSFLPVVICFFLFFINDMYGFINWQRMMKLQNRRA